MLSQKKSCSPNAKGFENSTPTPANIAPASRPRRSLKPVIYDEEQYSVALEASIAASFQHGQIKDEENDTGHDGKKQQVVTTKRSRGRPPKTPGHPKERRTSTGRPVGRPKKDRDEDVKGTTPVDSDECLGDMQLTTLAVRKEPPRISLWTDGDEQRLQQAWAASDQLSLDTRHDLHDLELTVWDMVNHIFSQSLADLFTYGLKIDDSSRPRTSSLNDNPVIEYKHCPSSTLCKSLQALLCHPIWEGDLSLVRYTLQTAIMHRVPHHIFPIAPLPNSPERSQFVEELLAGNATKWADDANFLAYKMSEPLTRPAIKRLCDNLPQHVERGYTTSTSFSRQGMFFLLINADVQAVIKALDQLKTHGSATCIDRLIEYKVKMHAHHSSNTVEAKQARLARWRKDWILDTRRRWIMANRHWKNGAAASAEDEARAYDIPEGDPCPAHLYCEKLGATEKHVELLRGTIWPLNETLAPDAILWGLKD